MDAFRQFNLDDGWAIASHIALSALMSLFPFLLVATALAGMFGSRGLAESALKILLETWPEEVAGPLTLEVHGVLASAGGNVLTLGVVLAIYFSTSGVDGLRVGLNRAYGVVDDRSWWLLRLESVGWVLLGAVALLVLGLLVLLAPLIWRGVLRFAPALAQFTDQVTLARFGLAGAVLTAALIAVHRWLPAGKRTLMEIAPGIAATLVLSLITGAVFGLYLAEFAYTYAIYYAGLASVMIILVFLYLIAAIFVYGGELNAAIRRARSAPAVPDAAAAAS
jgi:membrane protein